MDDVLRFWVAQTGFRNRLEAYGAAIISRAEADLARLLNATDADAARSLLSKLGSADAEPRSKAPVRALADVLMARCLQDLEREEASNLVGWYELVAEFCGLENAFSAHARALAGISHSLQANAGGAALLFTEALESYQALRGTSGLVVAMALAAAEATARQDDVDEAKRLFELARRKANEADDGGALVQDVAQRWDARWLLLDGLSLPGGAPVSAESADYDVWSALKSRAIHRAANGRIEEGVTTALVADQVGAQLGRAESLLRALTDFAISRQELAFAEPAAAALIERGDGGDEDVLRLVRIYSASGRTAQAEALARQVARRWPTSAAAERELGVALYQQNRLDGALSAFGRAVALDPNDINAAHLLQTVSPPDIPGVTFDRSSGTMNLDPSLLQAGSDVVAAYITAAVVRADPRMAEEVLAATEASKGPEFMVLVRQLLFPLLRQTQGRSSFQKAEALFQEQRFDDAVREYWLAIEEDPENNLAYMGIGDCHYQAGKFNLAAAFFEESIAVAPHVSTYRFLGDAHRRCGRLPLAREAYDAAIALNPDYAPARQQLAIMDEEAEQAHA